MTPLSLYHVAHLVELLASGTSRSAAIPLAVGGTELCDGIWRFFSDMWPEEGISGWNVGSAWESAWQPFLAPGLFAFGEDVFGNQLVVVNGFENAVLWNHENGECFDLLVSPSELLRTALESGIDWIDFYSDGSLAVAAQSGIVPLEMHLHWITPLILGGHVDPDNLILVHREPHLVGHAKLWRQIAGLPPETTLVPTQ